MTWTIYYGDGTPFSSEDGSPAAAPPLNVQVVAAVDAFTAREVGAVL